MTTAHDVLLALYIRGITLRVEDGYLVPTIPAGAELPADLLQAMRERKAEILARLSPSHPSDEERSLMARMDRGMAMLQAREPHGMNTPEYERLLCALRRLEGQYKHLSWERQYGGMA